ncbi:bifunctional phosphoribosyl-AMP cyclohydrolase/phosphoribosyl-ATP diphosphatase HisIE [Dokdonella sp.]|uniref:bifunctional phosphoribosyl-AMP cyclohydrolase/phosphoribosyl-ATP diphosphatase HisIE n=1 Tax=Dokdonella sp. TaxID=2291710 RepID=UPI0031BE2E41|nr:bifunctional phosphoribosyl-AMP cyclohydrolase/phosphoribosyl-ATP diphosphatase HisIE [Dokdonella sp.]
MPAWAGDLAWDKQDGLLPAIVQDADTRQVLMLGYMDRAALAATWATGSVTFFSRSRQRLWTKGETSGHRLGLVSIDTDCDRDTLLVQALPAGPVCHTGQPGCFGKAPADALAALDRIIAERVRERPEGSYTARLLASGIRRIAQKVGEEGVETALAGAAGDIPQLREEAADLLYHLIVLLRASGIGLAEVAAVLARRQRQHAPANQDASP